MRVFFPLSLFLIQIHYCFCQNFDAFDSLSFEYYSNKRVEKTLDLTLQRMSDSSGFKIFDNLGGRVMVLYDSIDIKTINELDFDFNRVRNTGIKGPGPNITFYLNEEIFTINRLNDKRR